MAAASPQRTRRAIAEGGLRMHEVIVSLSCLLMVLAPCAVVIATNVGMDREP